MMFGLGLSCLSLGSAGRGILQTATAVVTALNPFAATVTATSGYVIIAGSASITVQPKPESYGTAQTVAGSVTSGGAVTETTAGSVLAAAALAGWLDGETPVVTVTLEVAAVPTTGLVYRPDFTNLAYLWQDSAGTTPVTAAGQNIGRAADTSGAGVVAAALQAVSANRPILGRIPAGGRRNLLTYTEQLDSAAWSKSGLTVGSGRLTEASGGTAHQCRGIFAAASGSTYTLSVDILSASTRRVALRLRDYAGSGKDAYAVFDPATGSVMTTGGTTWSASVRSSSAISGGYRVAITVTVDVTATIAADVLLADATNSISYSGNGTSFADVSRVQVEPGAVTTAYQRVVSQYDVTEVGQADKWYLYDNDVNYALTVALTGTYSVYWDVAGALQYSEAVSMAGAYDILRNGMRRCAIYSRALDASERAALAAYWGDTA